ncbi:hypothetical protein [Pseudomonas sp. CCC3.1]|uniref:hypothetical protein n=1 Tax=Pseudomonas sp. CCC3.1 TaxID=3048607 RepID=UPI002AC9226F|nr:hypothetical protein [Pseudomonas sp. CCC3.1]MEB0207686.1 hypothetical protein [Pseudomonas sp. CCC3.1]WPX34519.1 hypothetical protein RHM56_14455 [Pseudomonas sp. CCC3.1]
MKRYLRLCLIFVLSLTLPLSGMAGVQSSTEPCPMQALSMKMMDDMGMDCCADSKAPSDHGKSCKPGQECKAGTLLQVSVIKPALSLRHPVTPAFFSDAVPASTPSGVWRPPRV